MKVMCMYLPQFHTFPENDKWWGEGYTEWVAVKRAEPLYRGHCQPKVPLGGNYYDLSNDAVETLKWQASLAREYGIYGFSIYQYYFNGKTLMHKPLETLLAHPEIDIRYNICWANESWTRTWYGHSDEVLMEQSYGSKEDWRKYFEYLLPYFRDERYIKVDGKPVLQIYKTFDIPCLYAMLDEFDAWAMAEGFAGIYVISGKTAGGSEQRENLVDAFYFFEPGYTLKNDLGVAGRLSYNFSTLMRSMYNRVFGARFGNVLERRIPAARIMNKIAGRKYKDNEFPGIIPMWDNTPRRGYKGLVYTGTSPELFEKTLKKLKDSKESCPVDFVYVNAWNEWGEGAYLEPDEKDKYAYLEAIRRVMQSK